MANVLIATLYSIEPVLIAANRLGPDRLILLIDEQPDKKQTKNLQTIKESIGLVIDVKTIKTKVYDIVSVAKKCVEIIDLQPKDDTIYVNITAGRKTKALGLLFASYARSNRVNKIAYNPEEDKNAVIWLPKLSFKLNESQKKILEALSQQKNKNITITQLSENIQLSRAMVYRTIDELRDQGYIETEHGLKLTDAGKIARL